MKTQACNWITLFLKSHKLQVLLSLSFLFKTEITTFSEDYQQPDKYDTVTADPRVIICTTGLTNRQVIHILLHCKHTSHKNSVWQLRAFEHPFFIFQPDSVHPARQAHQWNSLKNNSPPPQRSRTQWHATFPSSNKGTHLLQTNQRHLNSKATESLLFLSLSASLHVRGKTVCLCVFRRSAPEAWVLVSTISRFQWVPYSAMFFGYSECLKILEHLWWVHHMPEEDSSACFCSSHPVSCFVSEVLHWVSCFETSISAIGILFYFTLFTRKKSSHACTEENFAFAGSTMFRVKSGRGEYLDFKNFFFRSLKIWTLAVTQARQGKHGHTVSLPLSCKCQLLNKRDTSAKWIMLNAHRALREVNRIKQNICLPWSW